MSEIYILLWGGPLDGQEQVICDDLQDVRLAYAKDDFPIATESPDPSSAIAIGYLDYQRTDWVKPSGHRVYKYRKNSM